MYEVIDLPLAEIKIKTCLTKCRQLPPFLKFFNRIPYDNFKSDLDTSADGDNLSRRKEIT